MLRRQRGHPKRAESRQLGAGRDCRRLSGANVAQWPLSSAGSTPNFGGQSTKAPKERRANLNGFIIGRPHLTPSERAALRSASHCVPPARAANSPPIRRQARRHSTAKLAARAHKARAACRQSLCLPGQLWLPSRGGKLASELAAKLAAELALVCGPNLAPLACQRAWRRAWWRPFGRGANLLEANWTCAKAQRREEGPKGRGFA